MRLGFRTRLVLLFVLLAIVPIILLTVLYLRYLTDVIEFWQNPGIERTLENSLAVARESLEHYRQEAEAAGEFILVLLDPGADAEETSGFLHSNTTEVDVDVMAIYRRHGDQWTCWAVGGSDPPPNELVPEVALSALNNTGVPPLDLSNHSVYALLPMEMTPSSDLLLVGVRPPVDVMQRIRLLAADVDLYRQLGAYERIQAATIIAGTLAVVVIVVLAAFLVARFLAKSISRPILELVEGTRRVSSGDLDHPVHVRAKDEVGLLIDSFNQMTDDLRVSKENLRRAERVAAWRDVARRIAHEIKNPLTPVQLSIHRLRKRPPKDDAETRQVFTECLDLMDTEVSNLRRLADEFSQFARMPAPKPLLSDLGELTRSVADLYAGSNPDIETRLEIPGGLPDVPVDPSQFRQAVGNLIKNAVEAMPGGGHLTVALWTTSAPARPAVVVSVADSGPGLTPEIRDHIFDPYVTSKKQGTGLGLSIVHRIVTDHGGSVEVDSVEGKGTTFRLLFPYSPES